MSHPTSNYATVLADVTPDLARVREAHRRVAAATAPAPSRTAPERKARARLHDLAEECEALTLQLERAHLGLMRAHLDDLTTR